MKRVEIPREQKPTNYLVVRVQIVHVKKGWLGLKDKELSRSMVVPNKPMEAIDLFCEIGQMMEKLGVPIATK